MKRNIKKAFTLAEILVALMIIGFVAVVMIKNIKTEKFHSKATLANAYKALDAVEQASMNIRQMEQTNCPMASFMVPIGADFDYTLVNDTGGSATSSDVLALYGKYLKFDNTSTNFCDLSGVCPKNSIKAGVLPGGATVGFEVTGVADCPNYYTPGVSTQLTGRGKCWGKLYIDANGKDGPNAYGQDIFVLGLDGNGVVH